MEESSHDWTAWGVIVAVAALRRCHSMFALLVSNYFLGSLRMSRETLEIHVPFLATLLIPALRILNSILKLRFP